MNFWGIHVCADELQWLVVAWEPLQHAAFTALNWARGKLR